MRKVIYTVGYEGQTVDSFVESLLNNQVEVLVDARFRPQSRKKGFSKTGLASLLQSHGISYIHERLFGTPPEVMSLVRRTGGVYSAENLSAYRSYLLSHSKVIEKFSDLATKQAICLMCYEKDYSSCHRQVVAEELAYLSKMSIKHL